MRLSETGDFELLVKVNADIKAVQDIQMNLKVSNMFVSKL